MGYGLQQLHGDTRLSTRNIRNACPNGLADARMLQSKERPLVLGDAFAGSLDGADEGGDEPHAPRHVLAHVPLGDGGGERGQQVHGQAVALGKGKGSEDLPQGAGVGVKSLGVQIEHFADAAGQLARIRRVEPLRVHQDRLHGEMHGQAAARTVSRMPGDRLGERASSVRLGRERQIRGTELGIEQRLGLQHKPFGVGPLGCVEVDDLGHAGRQALGELDGGLPWHVGEKAYGLDGGEGLQHVPHHVRGLTRPPHRTGPIHIRHHDRHRPPGQRELTEFGEDVGGAGRGQLEVIGEQPQGLRRRQPGDARHRGCGQVRRHGRRIERVQLDPLRYSGSQSIRNPVSSREHPVPGLPVRMTTRGAPGRSIRHAVSARSAALRPPM